MANLRNIRTWVEALRSGEYQQGKGHLAFENTFCCLGVACELAVKDGIPVKVEDLPDRNSEGIKGTCRHYDGNDAVLPPAVRDWLGLEARDPYADYNGERHKLSKLNDDGGFNFNDIADIIERSYLKDQSGSWWDNGSAGMAA